MNELGSILLILLRLFSMILVWRILIEMIQSFSRSFRPPRWFAVIGEVIFTITDPPVKLLRKLIPPVRMGGVALDVSVLALFFLIIVLQILVQLIFF